MKTNQIAINVKPINNVKLNVCYACGKIMTKLNNDYVCTNKYCKKYAHLIIKHK